MLKILWFSNVVISDDEFKTTGTWLYSLSKALVDSNEIILSNITHADVKDPIRKDSRLINQWLLPSEPLNNNGLPSFKTIEIIQGIVDEVKPDIIQIWGTENYWGLLTARGFVKGRSILEIQGLKFVCAKYFYSGLTFFDIIRCFGLKEFIKPSVSLFGQKKSFRSWGKFEIEMLLGNKNISTQSDWVRAYIRNVNPTAHIYNTSILLRSDFIDADKWEFEKCINYQVFTSTSSIVSYKGLHVLLDAIGNLKRRYPQIRLVIAGSVLSGIRQGGYVKLLKRKISILGLEDNVVWLGSLDAKNIVLEMQRSNVVAVPSFIESYCLALDEALMVGVPTVVSYAGAMPELAVHNKTALFFPPGDVVMCANAIEMYFQNSELANEMSINSYTQKRITNKSVLQSQLSIYNQVMKRID